MNDITALMATMKAAAELIAPGYKRNWIVSHDDETCWVGANDDDGNLTPFIEVSIGDWSDNKTDNERLAAFIALAHPANVRALVEALEKAQTERDEFRNRLKLERSILEDADKRIAELEYEVKFPGVMRCNTCGFSRSRVLVTPGGVWAGESTSGHCPNGCGPMWHDTYRHQYNELYDAYKVLESRTVTVKLPKRSVGEVMHMSGFDRQYAEGWCSGNDNAINEMKMAGIQVIEGEG